MFKAGLRFALTLLALSGPGAFGAPGPDDLLACIRGATHAPASPVWSTANTASGSLFFSQGQTILLERIGAVRNQCDLPLCWIYSSVRFLEHEIYLKTGRKVELDMDYSFAVFLLGEIELRAEMGMGPAAFRGGDSNEFANYTGSWGVLPKEVAATLKPRGEIPWIRIFDEVNSVLTSAKSHNGNWLLYRNQANDIVKSYLGDFVARRKFSYAGVEYNSPRDFYEKNRLTSLQLPMKVAFDAGVRAGAPEGLNVAGSDFDKLIHAHLKRGLPAYLDVNWAWFQESSLPPFGNGFLTSRANRYGTPKHRHAILITGRMVDERGAVIYRLENSWGVGRGDAGYFTAPLGALIAVEPVIESRIGVRAP